RDLLDDGEFCASSRAIMHHSYASSTDTRERICDAGRTHLSIALHRPAATPSWTRRPRLHGPGGHAFMEKKKYPASQFGAEAAGIPHAKEVEKLIKAAKDGRWGRRDANARP